MLITWECIILLGPGPLNWFSCCYDLELVGPSDVN